MALEDVSEDQIPKEVKLVSSDGGVYVANREMLMEASGLLKNLLEDLPKTKEAPVEMVTGSILAMVLQYIKAHEKEVQEGSEPKPKKSEEWLKEFDAKFVNVDPSTLFEIIMAANYMHCKDLLELTCLTVANMIKGKTPRDIRKTFNIANDFSPGEEKAVRMENRWAFE
eukprot:jgi/Botrbrau1/18953/Bobra.0481s0002.1